MSMEFDYSDVIARILTFKKEDETEGQFAARLGISANTWTAYKQAKRSFGLHEIATICDELGADVHWVLFGHYSSQVIDKAINSGLIIADLVMLPMYDVQASLGNGLIAMDDLPSSEVGFQRQFLYNIGGSPDHCYLLEARGDSMWPTIPDGAILIADRSQTEVDDGRIYHFNVNERVVVKRARWRMDGRLYLTSDNVAAGYQDESFAVDRVDDLVVGGRIIFVGHAPLPMMSRL